MNIPRLLAHQRLDLERNPIFATRDAGVRGAARDARHTHEALELCVAAGCDLVDRLGRQRLGERLEHQLPALPKTKRGDLYRHGFTVNVDHQPGELIAFAVDQTVNGGVFVRQPDGRTTGLRLPQAAHEKGRVEGLVVPREYADGDLGAWVPKSLTDEPAIAVDQ